MNQVPFLFVDGVVGAFTHLPKPSSIPKLSDLKWTKALHDHISNRSVFRCFLQFDGSAIKCVFVNQDPASSQFRRSFTFQEIRLLDRHFVRIKGIELISEDTYSIMKNVQSISELEFKASVMKYVARKVQSSVVELNLTKGDFRSQMTLLENLHKRIYFSSLKLKYAREISEEFLLDQLENSASLRCIELSGAWEQSMLKTLLDFTKRKAHRVGLWLSASEIKLDADSLQQVIRDWDWNSCNIDGISAQTTLTEDEFEKVFRWDGISRHVKYKPGEKRAIKVTKEDQLIRIATEECTCALRKRCNLGAFIPDHHSYFL
ncbi:hypothetical protein L596_029338 [Steinernema carpocapsae]|uniref:DUF38 domain-containing protein n=1 Tax=Steinernema carpocapsae TaxID=34508 RepID=A0A4U5LUC3_STECR|nr:hypothetical protein L596_029338 [Steinernema carpocapsae]